MLTQEEARLLYLRLGLLHVVGSSLDCSRNTAVSRNDEQLIYAGSGGRGA